MRGKTSNDISSERTLQVDSQNIMHIPWEVSTKVFQRIVKFKILDFAFFVVF